MRDMEKHVAYFHGQKQSEGKRLFERFVSSWNAYLPLMADGASSAEKAEMAGTAQLALDEFLSFMFAQASKAAAKNESVAGSLPIAIIAAGFLCAALGLGCGLATIGKLSGRLPLVSIRTSSTGGRQERKQPAGTKNASFTPAMRQFPTSIEGIDIRQALLGKADPRRSTWTKR
jgi:hypothetical protein